MQLMFMKDSKFSLTGLAHVYLWFVRIYLFSQSQFNKWKLESEEIITFICIF